MQLTDKVKKQYVFLNLLLQRSLNFTVIFLGKIALMKAYNLTTKLKLPNN